MLFNSKNNDGTFAVLIIGATKVNLKISLSKEYVGYKLKNRYRQRTLTIYINIYKFEGQGRKLREMGSKIIQA